MKLAERDAKVAERPRCARYVGLRSQIDRIALLDGGRELLTRDGKLRPFRPEAPGERWGLRLRGPLRDCVTVAQTT